MGQGGNQAIESAAVLTNCLVDMLGKNPGTKPKLEELEKTLKQYQTLRQKRAKKFVDVSGLITRDDALATLRHTLRFLYTKPISGEAIAGKSWKTKHFVILLTRKDIQTEMYQTAPYLNFLPLPKHVKENELWKEGLKRVKAGDIVPRPR